MVQANAGASLIDLGDGVLCCEFHAKMNAIGDDIVSMIQAGVKRLDTDFDAMVIANQAANFSVGANLMLLLVTAQEEEWDDLHLAVRQFQNAAIWPSSMRRGRWWSRRKAWRSAAAAKSSARRAHSRRRRKPISAWWKPAWA